MTLVELSRIFQWSRYGEIAGDRIVWVNYAPGIWYTSFRGDFGLTDEAFWIPDQATRTGVQYVLEVTVDRLINLSRYASVSSLFTSVGFVWDNDEKLLYVRLADFDSPNVHDLSVGALQGFSDREPVYIDDTFYSPAVVSIPAISEQQDLSGYDKLAFTTGVVELDNANGDLDDLIDDTVFGNRVYIAYLPDSAISDGSADRSDVDYLVGAFVEDYDVGLRRVILNIADHRKAQTLKIPSTLFTVDDYPDLETELAGEPIPLAYGPIREAVAIPVTGAQSSGDVTFRVAQVMTDLGTIYTKQDDVWVAVTPNSTDAANGEFVLDESDARNASGGIYDCKLVDCEGIAITYASDVIKDLFEREADVTYDAGNYDTTEWEAEETALDEIGIVFDERIELYEAIRQIQSGANVGFRFEYLPDGRRTIRIDDWTRPVAAIIPNVDILNIDDLNAPTDASLLAAEVTVGYSKSWESGKFLSYRDASAAAETERVYRQRPALQIETLLTAEADAQDRAAYALERFGSVRPTPEPVLMGAGYLGLRIYDIVEIEYAPGEFDRDYGSVPADRPYYAVRKAQVLGVNPNHSAETNRVRMILIEEIVTTIRVTTGGDFRITTDDELRETT